MYCMSVWATTCLRRPAVPPLLAAVHPRLAAAEIRLLKKGTPAFTLKKNAEGLMVSNPGTSGLVETVEEVSAASCPTLN